MYAHISGLDNIFVWSSSCVEGFPILLPFLCFLCASFLSFISFAASQLSIKQIFLNLTFSVHWPKDNSLSILHLPNSWWLYCNFFSFACNFDFVKIYGEFNQLQSIELKYWGGLGLLSECYGCWSHKHIWIKQIGSELKGFRTKRAGGDELKGGQRGSKPVIIMCGKENVLRMNASQVCSLNLQNLFCG